jgi:mRNA interferase MazF
VVTWDTPVPDSGDIVWMALDPALGHEQKGRRPVLVLSPASYNGKVGLAICCPVTGQIKGYPFEVVLPAGLPVRGVILADQLRSLDWRSRQAEIACTLPRATVSEVMDRIAVLLPLQD